jgi:hypothetical protein
MMLLSRLPAYPSPSTAASDSLRVLLPERVVPQSRNSDSSDVSPVTV